MGISGQSNIIRCVSKESSACPTFPHRQRTVAGACVAALTAAFPVCFLEPALNHNNPHSIYNTMSDAEKEGNKYMPSVILAALKFSA